MEENQQITENETKKINPILVGGAVIAFIIIGLVVIFEKSASDQNSRTTTPTETQQAIGGAVQSANEETKLPEITVTDLAKHNVATDCYVAFNGDVYDVSPFVPDHPGGERILQKCGSVIDDFSSMHPGGEFDSPKVEATISNLIIGKLTE